MQVGAANGVAAAAHEEAARAEFKGHTQCVAALAWPAPGDQLFLSAGEDCFIQQGESSSGRA